MSTILVVDDSRTDQEIIKGMLAGKDVLLADDGVQALRTLDGTADIGLVVLDLDMPNMDGFQLLEVLGSDQRYAKLRTIILTNLDELDNEIKGLQLGAVDFIRKPLHMASLKARIEVHLELIRVQRELERQHQVQGATLEALFRHMSAGIAISFNKGPIAEEVNEHFRINPAFEKLSGRTREELLKTGWAGITHPDDLDAISRHYQRLQNGEISCYAADIRLLKPDGSIIWVHLFVSTLLLAESHGLNHFALVEDITARKTIEKNLMESERSKSVLLASLPGMAYRCNYDPDWTMKFVSSGCLALTGYRPEDLVDNSKLSFNALISPEYRLPIQKEWERVLAEKQSFRYEYEITTASGERKWVLEVGQASYDDAGEIEALEGIILDIAHRKEVEHNLRYVSTHDSATGLYNRESLEALLEADARKRGSLKRALVGLDLTTVRLIDYGFSYSEELIKKAAATLSQHGTPNRHLFRPHETRLVFYLIDYRDTKELLDFSEVIAEELDALFATERVGGGIGILEIGPDRELDADVVLGKLWVASERSISIFSKDFRPRFYDQDMEALVTREGEVIQELAKVALDDDNDGLFVEYQPILDLRSDSICGFEALARLNTKNLGLVSPLEFIPLAEKAKLIIPIGEKVMIKAFRFLNRLRERGYGTLYVTINVSVIQLLRPGFTGRLLKLASEMRVDPHRVGLEVTESVFASDCHHVNSILARLRDAGFYIAIDDFGTGYSSMSRVKELAADCLKIDKYFIDGILESELDAAITRDIVSIAHRLGYSVVAEGVEYLEQKRYLVDSGCDMIQGYLISRPVPEEAAMALLRSSAR